MRSIGFKIQKKRNKKLNMDFRLANNLKNGLLQLSWWNKRQFVFHHRCSSNKRIIKKGNLP